MLRVATPVQDSRGEPRGILIINIPLFSMVEAVLFASPSIGIVSLNADFDASDSFDSDGTIVTYEWDWDDGGMWEVVKYTEEGYVTGGFMNVSSPGTITFTARANLTATAFVTMAFNYNPPDDISVAVDPDSITAGGATAVVTGSVSGLHDGFASNGTVVNFETTLGTIDATALTTAGIATATLTSGSAEGTAVVTARVGELSDSSEVEITGIKIYLPIVVRGF